MDETNRGNPEAAIKEEKIADFTETIAVLKAYNDAHSMGSMMADVVLGSGGARGAKRRDTIDAAVASEGKAQKVGLSFDYNQKKGLMMFSGGEGRKAEELRLKISDAPSFVKFLHSIDVKDFENRPELQDGLATTIDILIQQMVEYYNPTQEDARGTALLDNSTLLLNEFRRLGMESSIGTLEEYLINSKRRTLNEFRGLGDAQCFEAPGARTFGPSQWHLDTNPAGYKERWEKIDAALLGALHNKNAKPLVQEALSNLIACADFAVSDMEAELAKAEADPTKAYGGSVSYTKRFLGYIEMANSYKDQFKQLQKSLAAVVEENRSN